MKRETMMDFVKKTGSYFIGTVFNKLCLFILLPIYTSNMSPIDYAENDLSISTTSMLTSFIFMEIQTAILRFTFECKNEREKDIIFCTANYVTIFTIPIFVFTCCFFSQQFNLPNVLFMTICGISFQVLYNFQMKIRSEENSTFLFAMSGVVSSVLQLIIALLVIYVLHQSVIAMYISPIIGNVIGVLFLWKNGEIKNIVNYSNFSKKVMKKLILFSIPLAINGLMYWGMTTVNRYFVRADLGVEENAYIAVATKFMSLINTLVQVFSLAWQEAAFKHAERNDRREYYSRMLNAFTFFMAVGTSCAILLTNILFDAFIDIRYINTLDILPMYLVAAYINALNSFYAHIFTSEKKNNVLLLSTILGVCINIGLLIPFLSRRGLVFVPLALALGYATSLVMRQVLIHNEIKINYKTLCVVIILLCISYLVAKASISKLFKTIVLLCLIVVNSYIVISKYLLTKERYLERRVNTRREK